MSLLLSLETLRLGGMASVELVRARWLRPEIGPSDLSPAAGEPTRREMMTALRLARVLPFVARALPVRFTCLQRALAAKRLLERMGVRSTLCLGVTDGDGRGAHAWLELGGSVIVGPPLPEDRRFVPSEKAGE